MTLQEFQTEHAEATRRAAAALAARLRPGAVLALHGQLGAGKTCFIQGLAEGLDVTVPVSSPTFTLVNEYPGRLPLYHIDLYRLRGGREAWALGLDDYLDGDGVTAIEWAERAGDLLPAHTVHVVLAMGDGPEQRRVRIGGPAPDPGAFS